MNNQQLNKLRLILGVILLSLVVAVPLLTPVNKYLSIPNEIVTFSDNSQLHLPQLGENVIVAASDQSHAVKAIDSTNFYTEEPGNGELVYEVNGFPIKKVNVSVLEDMKVIPGGQSIGVQLHTLGVLVVGHHLINGKSGETSPGEDADIKVGDVILEINGEPIKNMNDIKEYVEKAGQEKEKLDLKIKRGKETIKTKLDPILDKKDEQYKIGLYIRDSAAGIGTMTFYEPKSKKYGALGHVISDMDTKKPIEIHNGTIVRSSVTSIEKGNNGIPGEKQAKFSIEKDRIGTIRLLAFLEN